MIIGLSIILLLVLLLPFTRFVEKNLEVFLFIMGILAVTVSQVYSWNLVKEALLHPINIALAVLFAGLVFRWFQGPIEKGIVWLSNVIPYRLFIALFVIILGFLSSIITAIVAAIILVAVISVLRLDRKYEIRLVVLACFAIGLGAVLTPIGEPLSTLVVGKLDEDFFYLLKLVGMDVIPAVIIFGILAALMVKPNENSNAWKSEIAAGQELENSSSDKAWTDIKTAVETQSVKESYGEIVIRSLKIYLFVMALTFLGAGFEPFIEAYLLDLSPLLMYWINMVSAVLDNATLAAAEISPAMDDATIKDILMGLLISGGMLIPGNIPNIIAAGKLKITSVEYARFAFPIGLAAMVIYFIIILVL
jgi:predicted cation transporter